MLQIKEVKRNEKDTTKQYEEKSFGKKVIFFLKKKRNGNGTKIPPSIRGSHYATEVL